MIAILTRARAVLVSLVVGSALALGAVELTATPAACLYNPPAGYLGTCKTTAECTDKCLADPYNGYPGVCVDGCCICA